MTRPKTSKTEAVVLRQVPSGEADALLVLFTPERGKVRAMARGVRRPSSKLGGHLEPLDRVTLLLAQGQNLDVVAQAHLLHSNLGLRESLEALACGWYLADLVDAFTPDEAPNPALYDLLVEALGWLEESPQPALLLRWFELQLLGLAGYRPEVYRCVACRQPLASQGHAFSLPDGGVVCPDCRTGQEALAPLSLTALKVLRYLIDNGFPQARRLRWEAPLSQEVEVFLAQYIRYILEREVRSAAFLHRLEAWRRRSAAPATL
ncbi:MAG: DNA repair protein RecO [Dehalococcoidia bacterium]|nr:DNA repair protein RecO [Dehalococcoidia bacterium]